MDEKRREILIAGAGLLLVACQPTSNTTGSATNDEARGPAPGELVPVDVDAAEHLMREHGILRRALVIYRESATSLRQDAASVPPDALEKAVTMFRVFGEDYHQKKLEEVFIFPTLKSSPNPASAHVDVLMAQHVRGREITDYLLEVTGAERIATNQAEPVARALESFARMYEHHTAIEDTVIFPAWKSVVGEDQLDQLAAKFEEIGAAEFGGDGFESALKRMEEIETSLGIGKSEMFTAPEVAK